MKLRCLEVLHPGQSSSKDLNSDEMKPALKRCLWFEVRQRPLLATAAHDSLMGTISELMVFSCSTRKRQQQLNRVCVWRARGLVVR